MESCLRIGCGEGPKGMGVSAGEALIVGGGQETNQRTPLPTGERRHCGVWGWGSQAGGGSTRGLTGIDRGAWVVRGYRSGQGWSGATRGVHVVPLRDRLLISR